MTQQSNIEKLKTYKHILCIVESPNKIKSISKIIGKGTVFLEAAIVNKSSVGSSSVW